MKIHWKKFNFIKTFTNMRKKTRCANLGNIHFHFLGTFDITTRSFMQGHKTFVIDVSRILYLRLILQFAHSTWKCIWTKITEGVVPLLIRLFFTVDRSFIEVEVSSYFFAFKIHMLQLTEREVLNFLCLQTSLLCLNNNCFIVR